MKKLPEGALDISDAAATCAFTDNTVSPREGCLCNHWMNKYAELDRKVESLKSALRDLMEN